MLAILYLCLFLFEMLGAEDVLARQEAVEMARQKLQQQYDIKAQEFAVKQKEVWILFNSF